MTTITDDDLKMFQERARKELAGRGTGSIAWDSVIWDLCHEVRKLRSAAKENGDAAKLREAAVKIIGYLEPIRKWTMPTQENGTELTALFAAVDTVYQMANAALSAPPRNCDRFATVDEARKAYEEYRKDYLMRASNKFDFPMEFEAWLFATATEKEGGDK